MSDKMRVATLMKVNNQNNQPAKVTKKGIDHDATQDSKSGEKIKNRKELTTEEKKRCMELLSKLKACLKEDNLRRYTVISAALLEIAGRCDDVDRSIKNEWLPLLEGAIESSSKKYEQSKNIDLFIERKKIEEYVKAIKENLK